MGNLSAADAVGVIRGMSFVDASIVRILPLLPKALVWRVARRYIAGERLADALECVRRLQRQAGARATLDILGEDIQNLDEAEAAARAYCELLRQLGRSQLPAGVSVKPSQLGARLDPARTRELLEGVLREAEAQRRFVRIDMEDSTLTTTTLDLYRSLRPQHANVGVVLQARLHRSREDLVSLAPLGLDVRICKGIYLEPPAIGTSDAEEIRVRFLELLEAALEHGARTAIATHDPVLVDRSLAMLRERGASSERHEFQMLLGVGEPLRARISAQGWRLRVYVPFGASWHAYSLRRLRENPHLAGYVLRGLLPIGSG